MERSPSSRSSRARPTAQPCTQCQTHAPGPRRIASHHARHAAQRALRQPLRPQPELRHGLGACPPARSRVPHPEHPRRRARRRRHTLSPSASTPGTGRWGCWWRRPHANCAIATPSPLPARAQTPATGERREPTGMLDSLAYRNDAAIVLRRLMRSLPTRKGVLGIATCDKGLPAMMMALASSGRYPSILVPGGVTLLPEDGEDAGKVQSDRRALRPKPDHAGVCGGGRLQGMCVAGWRMPVPRDCGHLPGRRRGAWALPAAHRACPLRPAHLAGRGDRAVRSRSSSA